MMGRTLGNPQYDWGLTTEPQNQLNDRPIFLPRGKVLGALVQYVCFIGFFRDANAFILEAKFHVIWKACQMHCTVYANMSYLYHNHSTAFICLALEEQKRSMMVCVFICHRFYRDINFPLLPCKILAIEALGNDGWSWQEWLKYMRKVKPI
jgi:hypothetical protein